MFFTIQELEVRKVLFDVDFRPGEISLEERSLKQVSPLHAEGSAELLNNTLGEVRIRGKLNVALEAECDRCLEPLPLTLDSEFDLFYRPAPKKGTPHEIALDEGESQIGFYEGAGLDLGEVLREHILLSLPMHKVCGEDCRGMCPKCGTNLNTGSCNCEAERVDDRWAALSKLRGELGLKN